ncbi:hypothetical protein D3C76_1709210 [compost metagenome]
MHQVSLIVAVSGFQFRIQRILAGGVLACETAWVFVGLIVFRRIGGRAARVVIAHGRLFFFTVAFIHRDNIFLHVIPGFFQLAPVSRIVAIQYF